MAISCLALIVGSYQADALTVNEIDNEPVSKRGMAYEVRNKRLAIAEILSNALGKKLGQADDIFDSGYVKIMDSAMWEQIPLAILDVTYEDLNNSAFVYPNSDKHLEGFYMVDGYALHFFVTQLEDSSYAYTFSNVISGDVILEGEF